MLTSTIKYNSMTSEEQTGSYNTEFLAALSAFGNRIMCRFSVNNELYQSDDIRFIKRYSVVSLLKSVMYAAEIRIDGIHDLKDKVITDLQFGVSEDGINYYLVSFGSFTITDSPSDLAGGFTTLTAYDGMLVAMKNYTPVTYSSGETNYTYFCKAASAINLNVGSSIPSTGLMALPRIADVYTENNTYRDILDDYAEILGGCILVKNGALELVKPGNPVMTLDAGNLINFAPKDPFPLIDNLIFTSEGSITYKKNEQETGTIIRIDDNRLINPVSVDTYMNTMWNAIRNWGAFIPVEADSHGYMLFEPCDVINFSVNGSTYRTIWMSNDITISQGIAETISSDEPADRADDYFNSDEEHNFAVMVNNKLSSMVRQYGAGVLVSRYGQNIGALVNADGSFDVVQVTWDGNTPTAGAVLASYGTNLIVLKNESGEQYFKVENIATGSGKHIVETLTAQDGDPPSVTTSYETDVMSATRNIKVTRVSNSRDITSTCEFDLEGDSADDTLDVVTGVIITGSQIIAGESYKLDYYSTDSRFRTYSLGRRVTTTGVGASSLVAGNLNAASKICATAIGYKNYAAHDYSAAIGSYLKTSRVNQVVVGDGDPGDSNNRVLPSTAAFGVMNKGKTLFYIHASTGGAVIKEPTDGTYGYLYANNDSVSEYFMIALYDASGIRRKRIALRPDNIVVDGVNQFYKDGDSLTLNSTSPYSAYITNSTKTIRITIPIGKSLQFIKSIEVASTIGAIIGPNGYLNLPGETSVGSHQTQWDQCTVTATKIDNYTIRLQIDGTSAFYNATNNRPMVFVPSYGGVTFDFYSS